MRTLITLGVPLILTGLMVFSLVDIITIASDRVRHLPKLAWVLLVIVLSFVGSLLWFLLGREPDPSSPRARQHPSTRRGPVAPDDDPEFLYRLRREREQEERIRKLEQRLSELDDDKPE